MPTPLSARTRALVACLAPACLALAPTPPANAQQQAPAEAPGVRLSSTPVRVASIGLSMHVPEGSTSQTTSFGTTTVTQIQPLEELGVIIVQGRQSTDKELAPKQVGDGVIEKLLSAYGGETGAAGQIARTRARVLSRNSNLVIGSLTADRFYVELPPAKDSQPAPVNAYTIVSPTPGRVVVFELHTTAKALERARQVYETCIATATFEDPGDLASRRAAAVRAGVRLFEQMTPDDYREVFESFGTRWERLYTPHAAGADMDAQEHGYRRLKAWVGRRGDLNPERDPARWSNDDQEPGYLLQIDAMLLEPMLRVDTQAVYFLSMDRQEEAWTVRMSIRQNGQVNRWTETGARSDHSMSVTTTHGSAAPTVVRPLVQGEGYLSMVETYLLGPLLVRAAVPADFAFYSYQSRDGTIRLRTDSAEHEESTGTWLVTSRINEDAPPQLSRFTAEGEPIRTDLADGRVWEPTSYDRLVRLWRDKGLPLD